MKHQTFKLMVEHEGYSYAEMRDLSLEDAHKEEAHYKKLFPENNYWIEEDIVYDLGKPIEESECRFIPRGAADGWEDLYPDYER